MPPRRASSRGSSAARFGPGTNPEAGTDPAPGDPAGAGACAVGIAVAAPPGTACHGEAISLTPTRAKSTRPAPAAVAATSRRYRDLLAAGTDLAAMPLTDLCLLRDTLHTAYSDGLWILAETRIHQLRAQLRTAEPTKGEHKRLIKAAETALRNFGAAYRALRAYERSGHVGQAHQFHSTRPASGFNFLQFIGHRASQGGRISAKPWSPCRSIPSDPTPSPAAHRRRVSISIFQERDQSCPQQQHFIPGAPGTRLRPR